MNNTITADWARYLDSMVKREGRSTTKAVSTAVGRMLREERDACERLEKEVRALRVEVSELRGRLIEREAAVPRLRAVNE